MLARTISDSSSRGPKISTQARVLFMMASRRDKYELYCNRLDYLRLWFWGRFTRHVDSVSSTRGPHELGVERRCEGSYGVGFDDVCNRSRFADRFCQVVIRHAKQRAY